MKTTEKVIHFTRLASASLGEIGPLLKELNLDEADKQTALKTLGRALAYTFDIDQSICEMHPELTADEWKLINQDENAFRAELERLNRANNAEEDGNFEMARAMYDEIELNSKIENYRIQAQAGLYRIGIGQEK